MPLNRGKLCDTYRKWCGYQESLVYRFMATIINGKGLKSAARKLLLDERLTPNKRIMVMLMLAHWDNNDWALEILLTQFGSAKRMRIKDPDDDAVAESVLEKEAREKIREMFGSVEAQDADTSTAS